MSDTDLIGPRPSYARDEEGAAPTAHNRRAQCRRIAGHAAQVHTAQRVDQAVSGFSRAMGPIGFLSCLYIVGWMTLHLI